MADQPTRHEYRSGHDPRTLRDALGCFATGVTVVTCLDDNGKPAGITVNSFTSVSLDPPLLLVCLHKQAAASAPLTSAACFAVNVLQNEQQPASITFSTRVEDRFGNTPYKHDAFQPRYLVSESLERTITEVLALTPEELLAL